MSNLRMKRYAVVIAITTAAIVTGGVVAFAAAPSQFSVAYGDIRPARGTPKPASGTDAALWSQKSIATTTLTGAGRVVIGAVADNCNGSPIIRVTADGKVLGDVVITDHKNYGAHAVGSALTKGTHSIKIQFVNQFLLKGVCDRNVYIGSAGLLSATGTGTAAGGSPTTGAPTTTPPATTPPKTTTPKTTTPSTPTTSAPQSSTPTTSAAPTTSAPITGGTDTGDSGAKPGPSNTGVPAGTKLTVQNGDLTITKAGTVVDGLDVHGFVDIRADNVTIKNTIVRGRDVGKNFRTMISNFQNNKNLLVEDTTIVASFPSGYNDGLKGTNFTARRVNISKVVDTSLIYGDNVTIEDSWFHDNTFVTPWPYGPDNRTHSDNLQIQGGSNIKVLGNTFEKAQNTAIILTQDVARTSNVQIIGNWLSGGGCTVNIADKSKGPITGLVVEDNVFGASEFNCQMIVYGTQTQPTVSGNTKDGSTTDIAVQRRAS